MKLKEIMTSNPQSVAPDTTLIRAHDLMVWGKFRHLLVVDDEKLVGVLSERDVAAHQSRTGESIWSNPTDTVAMAMEPKVHSASPELDLFEAAEQMAARKIGCLPLLKRGKPVGLVTTADVLTACVRAKAQPPPRQAALIKDVMSRVPHTIHLDDSLADAAARMQSYHIRHLPVVDCEGRVLGMLSDRDLRTAIGDPSTVQDASRGGNRADSMRVKDSMSSPAITTTSEIPCTEAAQAFANCSISALPVVDSQNRLIGVVSYVDVLRALSG